MASTPLAAAREALAGIVNPRVGQDLLAAGMVEGLVIGDDGRPTFTFLLRRDDPATLVRQIRQAFQAAELPDPRIQIKDRASLGFLMKATNTYTVSVGKVTVITV